MTQDCLVWIARLNRSHNVAVTNLVSRPVPMNGNHTHLFLCSDSWELGMFPNTIFVQHYFCWEANEENTQQLWSEGDFICLPLLQSLNHSFILDFSFVKSPFLWTFSQKDLTMFCWINEYMLHILHSRQAFFGVKINQHMRHDMLTYRILFYICQSYQL